MSTVQTWQTHTADSVETEALAAQLGSRLKAGETIELISDLGGGKTTFVRGLAAGLGSPDKVASPSFTLAREYHSNDLTIYHFDFYRLQEAGIMGHELEEALGDPEGIVVVEWADIVQGVLPSKRLTIKIKPTSDNERQLEFSYPTTLDYLMEGLA